MPFKSLSEIEYEKDFAYIKSVNYNNNCVLTINYSINEEDEIVIIFFDALAYRCMDEGDLAYWDKISLNDGFIFEVTEEGWKSENHEKSLFFTSFGNSKEFLIIGQDECMNVICHIEPTIVKSK